MDLIKFASQKGARFIRADDLDKNFAMLQPRSNGTYGINEGADGWDLNILPARPSSMGEIHFLVYNPKKIRTSERDSPGLQWLKKLILNAVDVLTSFGAKADNQQSQPIPENSVLASDGQGKVVWVPLGDLLEFPPSYQQAGWKQVERCDGKRMYVWGTDWLTP